MIGSQCITNGKPDAIPSSFIRCKNDVRHTILIVQSRMSNCEEYTD